ncbi:MAG: sigma-70 family RNA polymerase sigma factor [Clostridia bacterium]|nr:sigma-70 family RNA polymerase sigma factor [Clostridia bacterium]
MPSDARLPERELVIGAQSGETQAMEALLAGYQGLLRMLAGRLCCEWVSREELIQAGNLGLMYAIARYDVSLDTKLITYAVPWILGEMRRMIRKAESSACSLDQPMDTENRTLYDVLPGGNGVDIGRIDLRLALSRLNPDEQILICLRYYRDKTQKETAEVLGKSQAQISKLERHALDALHTMLS